MLVRAAYTESHPHALVEGHYSVHSPLAGELYRLAWALVGPELAEHLRGAPGTLALADFGCADGLSGAWWLHRLLEEGDCRGRRVLVLFVDQPGNDFTELFARPPGWPRVTVAAVARTFYGRCAGDGALDLAWCSDALHWLRSAGPAPPLPLGALHHTRAGGGGAGRLLRAAHVDLTRFLALRALELREGGLLCLVLAARRGARSLGAPLAPGEADLFEELLACVREARGGGPPLASFACYSRSEAEVRLAAGEAEPALRLLSYAEVAPPCPVRAARLPAAQHAEELTRSVRSWAYRTVRAAVGGGRREAERVFELYRARVEREPRRHAVHGLYSVTVWRKGGHTPPPTLTRVGSALTSLRALGSRGSLRYLRSLGSLRRSVTGGPGR